MPERKGVHLWAILAVLMVLVVAGGAYALTSGDDDSTSESLRVEVKADDKADPVVTRLNCDDIDTAQLCDALTDDLLKPVPSDQMCTMIYGGPQTAKVTGTLRGKDVDAGFSRSNGCEIARWDKLVAALKPAGIKGLA